MTPHPDREARRTCDSVPNSGSNRETVTIQVPENAQKPSKSIVFRHELHQEMGIHLHKTISYIGYVPEVFESEEDFTEPLKCVEPRKVILV
jgi:hypothetical protein